MSSNKSWLQYSCVVFPDKTIAAELNLDFNFQNSAMKLIKENKQQKTIINIEEIDSFSATLFNDVFTFICIYPKNTDPKKASDYIFQIKNAFAFKFCGGVLSNIDPNSIKGKTASFAEELKRQQKVYETGINSNLVEQANKKINEVAVVVQNALKKELSAHEDTAKILDDSREIFLKAKSFDKQAKKMEPSCCRKFWTFSTPCIAIFVTLIIGVIIYGMISLLKCGDLSLIAGCADE